MSTQNKGIGLILYLHWDFLLVGPFSSETLSHFLCKCATSLWLFFSKSSHYYPRWDHFKKKSWCFLHGLIKEMYCRLQLQQDIIWLNLILKYWVHCNHPFGVGKTRGIWPQTAVDQDARDPALHPLPLLFFFLLGVFSLGWLRVFSVSPSSGS